MQTTQRQRWCRLSDQSPQHCFWTPWKNRTFQINMTPNFLGKKKMKERVNGRRTRAKKGRWGGERWGDGGESRRAEKVSALDSAAAAAISRRCLCFHTRSLSKAPPVGSPWLIAELIGLVFWESEIVNRLGGVVFLIFGYSFDCGKRRIYDLSIFKIFSFFIS